MGRAKTAKAKNGENMKDENVKTEEKTEYVSKIENESLRLLEAVSETENEAAALYPQMLDEPDSEKMREHASSLRRATANIGRASREMFRINDEFHARMKDIKKQGKRIELRPSNTEIDYAESASDSFAKGLNLYKILLIGFVGSFVGVIIELLWCLVNKGYLESRSGLVYGPFNLLYGAGAVVLTVCLYRFRNRGSSISFLGGMAVGSVLEYACSWAQEAAFGTRSWDYSSQPFNLNGRICLLYSIFWGILGVLWIKHIYPVMAKLILKIPNVWGKTVTWVLLAFFVFDSFMTVGALTRWSRRTEGVEPYSIVGEFFDERFPDGRMEKIFANMEFRDRQD